MSPLLKLFFDRKLKANQQQQRPKNIKEEFKEFYSNASILKVHPYESNTNDSPKFVNQPPTYKFKLYSNQSNDPKLNITDVYDDSHCDYIIDQLYSFVEAAGKKDTNTMDFILKDIFLQDCTFKTPAAV